MDEATDGIFHKILPPRLEDAGLEDCALPPDSIKEAFLKAASAVRSSFLSQSDDDEDESACDTLVGIMPDKSPPGSCAGRKGGEVPERLGDKVVGGDDVAIGDEVVGIGDVREEGECCVGELKGLKIGDKSKKKDEDKESEKPGLTEGYA